MSTYPKDAAFATLAAIVLASLKAKTQDFKKKAYNNDWLSIEDNSKPKGKKKRKQTKKTKTRQKVQDSEDKTNDKASFEKSEEFGEPVIKKDLELQSRSDKKIDESIDFLKYGDSTTKFYQLLRTLGVIKLENKTVIVVSLISNMKHKSVVFCTLPNGHVLVIPRNFIIKELSRSLWSIGYKFLTVTEKT